MNDSSEVSKSNKLNCPNEFHPIIIPIITSMSDHNVRLSKLKYMVKIMSNHP